MSSRQFNNDDKPLFDAVREQIKETFTERISYDQLAKRFQLNKRDLQNGFVFFFGQTIRDYRQQLRIEYGCGLMVNDNSKSINEIAWDCGYKDASAFFKAFLKRTSITPGEWRKRNGNGAPGN